MTGLPMIEIKHELFEDLNVYCDYRSAEIIEHSHDEAKFIAETRSGRKETVIAKREGELIKFYRDGVMIHDFFDIDK